MFNKQPTLTSIPELIEKDEEIIKWVPKKKHEVLKAKYKCLKKLFQIYDASVIGILPQNNPQQIEDDRGQRRKRSRRTKTDACAGTTDSSEDISETDAATVINELKLNLHSSSQVNNSITSITNSKDDKSTQDSKDASIGDSSEHFDRKKPTRFQIFLQRILGIRSDKNQCYGGSENNINRCERRRRNGLQFRRFGRPRKTNSDTALKGAKEPIILSYVQSIQRSYLTDTTPRHCPMVGCDMISYGIINYNDHLNLCHFPERKYICHYCHEGFLREYDKVLHENEHIGITKRNTQVASPPSTRYSTKIASNTQTEPETPKIDVPEEKLKKIVSFFDKITNPEKVATDIKNRSSEKNMHTFRSQKTETQSETTKSDDSSSQKTEKRGFSCGHFHTSKTSLDSNLTPKYHMPVRCQLCGECFENRRQLSLHVDLEHRVNHKFSKFHSCAGILNHRQGDKRLHNTQSLATSTDTNKSTEELSCDPSTNIIYYTSMESVRPSKDIVRSLKSGFCYNWQPCTSVVRI